MNLKKALVSLGLVGTTLVGGALGATLIGTANAASVTPAVTTPGGGPAGRRTWRARQVAFKHRSHARSR